jgi:hypothetical protein
MSELQAPVSQSEMLRIFAPLLLEFGQKAQKKTRIWARPALEGERVATITSDGPETENTALPGDVVVRNQSGAQETYVLPKNIFEKKYHPTGQKDAEWEEFAPQSTVCVLELRPEILQRVGFPPAFQLMARWQEPMQVRQSDYLATPEDGSEIYRIARKEFEETYQLL